VSADRAAGPESARGGAPALTAHRFGVVALEPLPVPAHREQVLHPEERAHADTLHPFRRETWVGGRVALDAALGALAAPRGVLLGDDRGAPTVAAGYSGSIAHKLEWAGAIAARADDGRVGIDVEVEDRERWAIASRVLTDAEAPRAKQWIDVLARFALKEAIYKAVDPWLRRYVGFREAEILDLAPADEDFVEVEGVLRVPEGTFRLELEWRRRPFVVALCRARRG
jgi:enterobactin synthetase component D